MTTDEIASAIEANINQTTCTEWHTGHLCKEDSSCNCTYIFADNGRMGGVGEVYVNDSKGPMDFGNDAPPLSEAKANQIHIALCNPVNISALLSERKVMREEIERMREALDAKEQS